MDSQDKLEDIERSAIKYVNPSPSPLAESDEFQWKFRGSYIKNIVTDMEELQLSPLEKDVIVSDWDSPDDPDMALNWPLRKKWITVILLATLTLLTYVALALIPVVCFFIKYGERIRTHHPRFQLDL
ncbi:hypothetical protein V1509DRAFT_636529 [Lipomyces kononenkoae]